MMCDARTRDLQHECLQPYSQEQLLFWTARENASAYASGKKRRYRAPPSTLFDFLASDQRRQLRQPIRAGAVMISRRTLASALDWRLNLRS